MLGCGGSTLLGQNLPYSSGSDGTDGPLDVPYHINYRENFGLAYDAARDEAVLFSGNWGSTYYPETWTMDPATGSWTLENPATFVSARRDHAMAYDPVNQVTILFGGYRADGQLMNDTWSWDGTDWTQLSPANAPSPRYDAVMAARPSDGAILLFGGYTGSNDSQTWMWDGTNWTALSPATTPAADRGSYNAMVYHEGLGGWFLYSAYYRRTWFFDGTDWSELTTAMTPNMGNRPAMAYDAARGEVVYFDGDNLYSQTWVFTTTNEWAQRSPATVPNRRRGHGMIYDSTRQLSYTTLGDVDGYYIYSANAWSTSAQRFSTYAWDGTDWAYKSGWLYQFDMNATDADGDGKWEFTTITVPQRIQVRFIKDAANSIVEWYATGDVVIDGYVLVEGLDAPENTGAGLFGAGGPGGGNGGIGGIQYNVSGSYAGTSGAGPGSGAPGVAQDQDAQHGSFNGVYGNAALQPQRGGSGGGGGGSNASTNGGNGGGGGGAIRIDSSRDITVNGVINADGGRNTHTAGNGGDGSGGSILLRADRVLGSGQLWARGGRTTSSDPTLYGRIRVEGFYRPLATNTTPAASATAPVESISTGLNPALVVVSIDGQNVVQPSTGNPNTPDVVFSDAGQVTIVVQATDIPAGTPVTLRIAGTGTLLQLPLSGDPEVTLDGAGQATFTATVPAGVGTVQAFASFMP